jgi:hypothetical protein
LPAILSNFPPVASPSYYVTNLNSVVYLGSALGQDANNTPGKQDYLVVLDFGRPRNTGSTYGTYLVFDQTYTFYSTTQIGDAVKRFAQGFWIDSPDDTESHVRIVVGTNNCCTGDTLSLFQGHGTAWAQMMASIASYVSVWSSEIDVVAGSDMEPEFNRPYHTAQWVTSLANATTSATCSPQSGGNNGCLYNFGTATNVLPQDNSPCASSALDPWKACDVCYVSWGVTKAGTTVPFARPLPEIYHKADSQQPYGTDATQWKNVALYSVGASYNTRAYSAMYFVGSLTQFAQCGATCYAGGITYANNRPEEGYLLLYRALGSSSITRQSVRWSTDIRTQP